MHVIKYNEGEACDKIRSWNTTGFISNNEGLYLFVSYIITFFISVSKFFSFFFIRVWFEVLLMWSAVAPGRRCALQSILHAFIIPVCKDG